jgi:hypothetical protein
VARAQIQKKAKEIVATLPKPEKTEIPKNKKTDDPAKNKILPYSAINKIANPMAAYSMLKPETSSDSPSAKSKGVRLDSANIEIIHIINKKGAGINTQK